VGFGFGNGFGSLIFDLFSSGCAMLSRVVKDISALLIF
jgi:hypothetical protein